MIILLNIFSFIENCMAKSLRIFLSFMTMCPVLYQINRSDRKTTGPSIY